jgi:SAM-dependent methyltransferase
MMLESRSLQEEQMDAPDLPPETYDAVLHDLARVNLVTMARRPTLNFLARLPDQPLTILDVGFGDGDMLRAIGRWAARHRRTVKLVGIDLNPKSAASAAARTPADLPITYVTGDYESLVGQGWDVILSSLVAHHMTHAQLIAFLRFMEREARLGWLINDLHRHIFSYLGFPLLARVMGWHRIVREDGQLSIARSYRPNEWPALLEEAAVPNARIFRAFPFRLCVEAIR